MEVHQKLDFFMEKFGVWTEERFLAVFDSPFLIAELEAGKDRDHDFKAFAATSTEGRELEPGWKARGGFSTWIVVPLVKSNRNKFPTMITMGRASTNDVVIPHPAISKFHAFFRNDPATGDFAVWDAESKFGTRVDGLKLAPGTPCPLRSKVSIEFAGMIMAKYFTASDFFSYMRLMTRLGADRPM